MLSTVIVSSFYGRFLLLLWIAHTLLLLPHHQSICAISMPNLSAIYLFFGVLPCDISVWYCHSYPSHSFIHSLKLYLLGLVPSKILRFTYLNITEHRMLQALLHTRARRSLHFSCDTCKMRRLCCWLTNNEIIRTHTPPILKERVHWIVCLCVYTYMLLSVLCVTDFRTNNGNLKKNQNQNRWVNLGCAMF